MYSWMIYGPFSLADATEAELTFDWWSDTYAPDFFAWTASIDGEYYNGLGVTGDWSSWATGEQLDLSAVPTESGHINMLGEDEVWIAFIFGSDESETDRGSFVDNVLLRKWVGGTASEAESPAVSQGVLQPDQMAEPISLRLNQQSYEH